MVYRGKEQIHLEQLTRIDIKLYVKDNLSHSPEMSLILKEPSEREALIDRITNKSFGVFFWVTKGL